VGDTHNDHAIGVVYLDATNQWAVLNQSGAGIDPDAAFNVLIPAVDTSVFLHIARVWNITDNRTTIDHRLTNGDPNAIVLVTQNWNPSAVGGTYNNHSIGVRYYDAEGKWAILNQDGVEMPPDAAFNVLVATSDPAAFVHTATAENILYNFTLIDHPLSNSNPNAMVLVTQNYNPGGGSGTPNDHEIGVYYRAQAKKWAVFNQDQATTMTEGAAFNVLVIGHKVHLPLVLGGS
jgi:hypothetical protein